MFNKKLFGLLIAGGLIFTACGQQPTPSGDDGEGGKVVHQDPLVKEVGESQTLRKFSSKFDKMVDDFSGATLVGTLTNGQRNEGLLRVLVDSENDDFPSTPGKAILKLGSPVFGTAKPEAFGFKVRKVGNGTLSTNDLVLGLRGVDSDANVYPINLSDALDEDGEALPELTNEWQDIVVDINNSIEDDNAVYPGTDSKISETDLLAFHLYAKAGVDVSQMIEIDQVYYLKGTDKVVISEFDGDLVTDTKIDAWWAESTGFIVRKGVNINGGSYELTIPEGGDAYNYVAVEMNGDSSAFTINDVAVTVGAVNGAYFPFAMQFTKSGNKLKFASTKDLNISKVFLTNMEEEKVDSYPVIDIEHKLVFDSFNRTQAAFTGDWDVASAADYTPDPISVALSYSNADKASVHDGYLDVQDADSYVNVKEANAAVVKSGYQYIVIVADGDLTDFRFTCNAGPKAMYSHDWLAAPGLKSIPQDLDSYPYKTGNFVHYIIDLTLMDNDVGEGDFLDFYFEGAVKIDSIYFANAAHKEVRYPGDTPFTGNPDLSSWAYAGYIYAGGAKQIEFTFEGEGNLKSFRFVDADAGDVAYWFKDGQVKGANGKAISADLAFTTDHPLTITVDLEQTGIASSGFHLHTGDAIATGSFTTGTYTRILFEQFRKTDTIALNAGKTQGYTYLGAYGQKANGAAIIEIAAVSNVENATLASLRLEGAVTVWGGDLVLEDGSHLNPTAKVSTDAEHPTVIRIDLAASFGTNAQYKADEFLHFHFGGEDTVDATITFAAKAYIPFTAEYEIGMYNVA